VSDVILILQKLRILDEGILEHRTQVRAREVDLERQLSEENVARSALAVEQRALKESAARRRDAEREVSACRDRKRHFEKQLNVVKNNVEYQALLKEIAAAERTAGEWEDQILEQMEQEELLQARIAKLEQDLTGLAASADAVRTAAAEISERAVREIATLARDRDKLLEQLPANVLGKYERLRESRDEVAIVTVEGGSCTGCHYGLPPQVANQVRQGGKILFCEGCGRFLVSAKPNG